MTDIRGPRGAAGIPACVRKRLEKRVCRSSVAEHDRMLGREAVEDRGVGARRLDLPVAQRDRVHRARAGSAETGRCELVWRRDVRPRKPEREQPCEGGLELLGWSRKGNVEPVEAGRGEGGVVHARRERLLDRPAQETDEPCGT